MEKFLDEYGYIALMIGTFFEGETAILVASSLIHRGLFEGPYTVLFGFTGSFISDWLVNRCANQGTSDLYLYHRVHRANS